MAQAALYRDEVWEMLYNHFNGNRYEGFRHFLDPAHHTAQRPWLDVPLSADGRRDFTLWSISYQSLGSAVRWRSRSHTASVAATLPQSQPH